MISTATRLLAATAIFSQIAAFALPAHAQPGFVQVASGKSKRVDAYLGWKNDCSQMPINIDVVRKPRHGTLSHRFVTETIRKASIGGVRNCYGKKVRALAIYYKSDRGYRGSDSLSVRISIGGKPANYNYNIAIR